MKKSIARFVNLFCVAILLLATPGILPAQTPPPQTPTPPQGSQSTGNKSDPLRPASTTSQQALTSNDEDVVQIYGLQGVLIETLDGKTVSAQSPDQGFNPASAVKLATALVALRNFGPQHRFTTGFWTDGSFDKATGQIQGNLYVAGRDPSFHYEHAVMVARQLNSLGIRSVTGNLVVAPGFTMNFSSSARRSAELLYDTLDSTLRSSEALRAWTYERAALGDQSSLQTVPSVAVMGEVLVGTVSPGAKLLLSHRSSKLTDVLKVLLCYSNNFMAERIGDSLGGKEAVRRQLVNTLGISPVDVQLASLSGLGVNRVTPRAMMKIFRALRDELQKSKLNPADIMPVAGIDPGTLEDRFTGPAWQGSVIAKTGTLVRTDGGASSLVGQMKTAKGEVLLFVIMNQHGNVVRFRENQDYLVMQVQNSRGGPKAFNYKPLALTMKLADTESVSGSANNEFEPNLKAPASSP
ncbi:MAG: D-alanyl-D-alanine carboxypeptidase [Acidobacteriota bacterium]|nr:D-alanyl-D-alanine carboxypeptidase [Acidobacteriota bacterium]